MVIFYVHAQAGKEITILRSIYADRKPSHRKPSHAKEKTSQTVLRIYEYLCVYVTETKKSQPHVQNTKHLTKVILGLRRLAHLVRLMSGSGR